MRGGNLCLDCPTFIFTTARTSSIPARCSDCTTEVLLERARVKRAARPEVAQRRCVECGEMFTPYRGFDTRGDRERITTCSRKCFHKTPRGKEVQRASYMKHRDRRLAEQQARKYGVTVEWIAERTAEQEGRCAICGDPPTDGKRLHVDHCHTTGQPRGLLCTRCNPGLGYFRDNPALLSAAIDYLKETTHA